MVVACESEVTMTLDPRRDFISEGMMGLGTLTELVRVKRSPVYRER